MSGQVPVQKKSKLTNSPDLSTFTHLPTYLLVGRGRLAQHLKFYLSSSYARKSTEAFSESPSHELALLEWNREQPLNLLQSHLEKNPIVLLAISDSSILSFYKEHLSNYQGLVIHFSGSIYQGPLITAHPLMTFGHSLYDLSTYEILSWTLCGAKDLQSLFPWLKNKYQILMPEELPLYHGLCVSLGNISQILWQQAFKEFSELNLRAPQLEPFLKQSLKNFLEQPDQALTGPMARNDTTTIRANLKALKSSPLLDFYKAALKTRGIPNEHL